MTNRRDKQLTFALATTYIRFAMFAAIMIAAGWVITCQTRVAFACIAQDQAEVTPDASGAKKSSDAKSEKAAVPKQATAPSADTAASQSASNQPSASKKKEKEQESEVWEFSPYSVRVWIGYDFFPEYSEQLHQQIVSRLPQYAEVDDHSGWRLSADRAPEELRYAIVNDLEEFVFQDSELELDEVRDGDKLMLVGVSRTDRGYSVSTREYDCRLAKFSSVVQQDVVSTDQLPSVIYQTIRQAFVPLARVLTVEDKNAMALVRAGGLLTSTNIARTKLVRNTGSPCWISAESVCSPVQRRSVRKKGKTIVQTTDVEWTFAVVEQLLNKDKAPELSCNLYSAMRTPLGGKRGSRTERILRVCKPNFTETVLYLTDREEPPQPAAGYQIYKVIPGEEDTSELIGRTLWNGEFLIESGDQPLVLLYVRSGSRTLARLPIVPGEAKRLTAAMFSDAIRLRAEGIVRGMQSNLLNLIAQRQSLSVQIQVALENKELQQAELLMSDFSELQTGNEFISRMEAQAASLISKDQRENTKIDRMFSELRNLVAKHLTSDMNVSLTADIEYVRAGNDIKDRAGPDQLEALKNAKDEE